MFVWEIHPRPGLEGLANPLEAGGGMNVEVVYSRGVGGSEVI